MTPGQLWAATLFQWRVFSLETNVPTGFQRGPGDPAAIELLRAVVEFFTRGFPNAKRYEGRVEDEFAAGPDGTPGRPPAPGAFRAADRPDAVVRRCSDFVDGFGLSVTADAADGERLGLASLRLRRLPPREALWPREGEDDHGDGHDYRYAAYITGLAVAKSARRRGVASTLVDYAERKGAAWGAAGLCLHVNRLNTPALRLYDRLGFSVVPDWYGYNNQRFLLFKPLNGEAPETPPPAAPPRNALSPLQKEILVDGETEPPGASAKPGGLDFELEEAYGTAFPAEGRRISLRPMFRQGLLGPHQNGLRLRVAGVLRQRRGRRRRAARVQRPALVRSQSVRPSNISYSSRVFATPSNPRSSHRRRRAAATSGT